LPDAQQGLELLRTLRVYPLAEAADPPANDFQDVSDRQLVANPCTVDGTFEVWTALKRALDRDVPSSALYNEYGLLADLRLRKDQPFEPDAELRSILTVPGRDRGRDAARAGR
jgi:hypothetical protein